MKEAKEQFKEDVEKAKQEENPEPSEFWTKTFPKIMKVIVIFLIVIFCVFYFAIHVVFVIIIAIIILSWLLGNITD